MNNPENINQPEDEIALQWVSHPVRESAAKSALAVGAVLASGIAVTYFMSSPGFGLLAVVIMFFSLSKFFFPTSYTLSDKGVTVKTTTQTFTRSWNQYRSYFTDKSGVLLSPFARPSRLENFRGLYITFSGNREEVISIIKSKIQPVSTASMSDTSTDSENGKSA